mmetsp:Transcript_8519/g.10774  ORF Transcript_8519/g.10774 Transcript_8519/m.10774 type:complete len:188 (+) Transcript_8519:157-720(+)
MPGALASVREKASKSINRAAGAMGIETKSSEDNTALDEMAELCPKLTYQQRITGFVSCWCIGYVITFMSFNFFIDLIEGNPVPFVVLYTFGNIVSLCSSMFLCGPKRQFKRMFDDTRKIITIVYLSTLLLSIIICFIPFNSTAKLAILVILLITQFLASIWYNLSFIPLARRSVKKFFNNQFDGEAV